MKHASLEIDRSPTWLSSRALCFAAVCVVLGSVAYVARFDPLWLDELTSYWLSSGPDVSSVFARAIARNDPHPPGYQLALFAWFQLPMTADSGLFARASSLLALAVALFAGASLATRSAGSRDAGLAFVVIYGSLAFVVHYGSELRSYMGQQAALLMLLLARRMRVDAPEERDVRLLCLEYVSAFVLGTWHYVGALFAGAFVLFDLLQIAFDGSLRSWRERFARGAISLPYLIGPLFSLAWLVGAPTGPGRRLGAPDLEKYFNFFVRSWGEYQLIPLVIALGLILWHARRTGDRQSFADKALYGDALAVLLGLVLLTLFSQIRPVLQTRNILLFWPPQVVLLSVAVARVLPTRWFVLILAIFPLTAVPGLMEYLEDDQRSGENFRYFSEQNDTYPLLCGSDDMAQKIVDAGRLERSTRGDDGVIIAEKMKLGTGAAVGLDALKDLQQVLLACPHCKKRTLDSLKAIARRYEFRSCKELRTPAKDDKAFLCRKKSKPQRL